MVLHAARLALSATAIALTAAAASPAAAAEKLKVVASFSIIGDFAEQVGGDRVAVTTLVGPNGDTHVYEPKPADVAAIAGADVILVNGLHFEGFLERLVEASGTGAPVVELTEGVHTVQTGPGGHGEAEHAAHSAHPEEAASDGGEHGGSDPHAFQSVPNAKIYVENVAEAFCSADAEECGLYRERAKAYAAQLDALDAEIRAAVAAIPVDKRTVITSHGAFGYFEHEYGITFRAPEGVSTESEASAADVAKLIREIRAERAAAVFLENVSDPRLIEQIAAETGLTVRGELYSDALSEPSGPAATYLDLMRHNVQTIKGAILGS